MYRRLLHLLCIISICSTFGFHSAHAFSIREKEPPDQATVDRALDSIVTEQQEKNRRIQFRKKLITAIAERLRSSREAIRFAFLLLVITVGLILCYFAVKLVMGLHFKKRKIEVIMEDNHQKTGFNSNLVEGFIENGDWTLAILNMHRDTIVHIMDKELAWSRNMTNLDYRNRLPDRQLADAFMVIAGVSEKILFDDYKANESDCDKCFTSYNSFINGIPGSSYNEPEREPAT
jgi:hypothetical protein